MGQATEIAKEARRIKRSRETIFTFKESEFKKFCHCLISEQKNLCGQQAEELATLSNSNLTSDVIESARNVDVI